MCGLCQQSIGGQYELNCGSCTTHGEGKCDPNGCQSQQTVNVRFAIVSIYNTTTKMCETCQQYIGGENLHCGSCTINGGNKCEPDGCPAPGLIRYNHTTEACEDEKMHKPCKI